MNDLEIQVQNLVRIGIALSSERNIDALLEMIVDESRRFTEADGGTLYVVSDDGEQLEWKILQSDTMKTRMGGTSGVAFELPPVPLRVDGEPNRINVSAHVANTGQYVNIPDVYEAEGFDFSGMRRFDEANSYRSKSMLVVPMRNYEHDVIGVLQLINARASESQEVVPFAAAFEDLVLALASQAAVAITSAQLIADLRGMFDAFIQTTAAAIDEKSPYTAGHVRRVTDLTMQIAGAVNDASSGPFADTHFTQDELEELRIAAWMHDVGKITTPEYVVDKATKLETIYDRFMTIRTRWEVRKRDAEISALRAEIVRLGGEEGVVPEGLSAAWAQLDEELGFVSEANAGGEFMADEAIARLATIGEAKVKVGEEEMNCLTENELRNLSIRKGTLTDEERDVIANHAAVSIKMLSKLPFSKGLSRVPEYAGAHHEKLNGRGYPRGLTADELSTQARILAVADIFEALTAPDRPYRDPMPVSQALQIIGYMIKDKELDSRIVELLVDSGVAREYVKRELREDQVDV